MIIIAKTWEGKYKSDLRVNRVIEFKKTYAFNTVFNVFARYCRLTWHIDSYGAELAGEQLSGSITEALRQHMEILLKILLA
jgi:hypothetical protein